MQLLRSNSYIPIKEVEYVDLSGKDICKFALCKILYSVYYDCRDVGSTVSSLFSRFDFVALSPRVAFYHLSLLLCLVCSLRIKLVYPP